MESIPSRTRIERPKGLKTFVGSRKAQRVKAGTTSVLVMSLVLLTGCTSSASSPDLSGKMTSSALAPAVQKRMVIETGKMVGKPGWPKVSPANISFPKGSTVVLTIINYDDGTAPLPPSSPYGDVWGSDPTYGLISGGTETVDGKVVTQIPNDKISHTFTIPGLLVNIPIPAVPPNKKTTTVVFKFQVNKSGTFLWLCVAPCGSGSTGMGGAMGKDQWMRGFVTVT